MPLPQVSTLFSFKPPKEPSFQALCAQPSRDLSTLPSAKIWAPPSGVMWCFAYNGCRVGTGKGSSYHRNRFPCSLTWCLSPVLLCWLGASWLELVGIPSHLAFWGCLPLSAYTNPHGISKERTYCFSNCGSWSPRGSEEVFWESLQGVTSDSLRCQGSISLYSLSYPHLPVNSSTLFDL